MSRIQSLNPAVPQPWLQILAGLAWSAVGLMLGRLAAIWLMAYPLPTAALTGILGFLLAILVSVFFSIMARKNVTRIQELPDKACVFAFQQWFSYPLIVFMVTLGLLLRHSALPRNLLAILYLGIGGGLMLASRHYFLHLINQGHRFKS